MFRRQTLKIAKHPFRFTVMVLLLTASLYLVAHALTGIRMIQIHEQALEGHSIAARILYSYYLANMRAVGLSLIEAGVLWLCGIAVWYLPKKKGLLAWFLIISILMLPPTATVSGYQPWELLQEKDHWYARVYLMSPLDVKSGGVTLFVTKNEIMPCYTIESFTGFALFYLIAKPVGGILYYEWLEAGWFQNSSNYWLYSVTATLDKDYIEIDHQTLDPSDPNLAGGLPFWITQEGAFNHFVAFCRDTRLRDISFTISGDVWLHAGGESTCHHNSMNGYCSSPWYSDSAHQWADVMVAADTPYKVVLNFGSGLQSWDTCGGYLIGDINHDGVINYLDVFWFRKAYCYTYNPCADFDGDGDVDYADLYLFKQQYQKYCLEEVEI